jgi:predicted CoA-binding protein
MARRIERSFFLAKDVAFIGYSRRQASFCASVEKAFAGTGARVYPVNPRGSVGGRTVYRSIAELPAVPDLAFIMTGKDKTKGIVEELAAKGSRRILFQSSMCVDDSTLEHCSELGIETAVACPLMGLGGGFHRFHGFLAGVRA